VLQVNHFVGQGVHLDPVGQGRLGLVDADAVRHGRIYGRPQEEPAVDLLGQAALVQNDALLMCCESQQVLAGLVELSIGWSAGSSRQAEQFTKS